MLDEAIIVLRERGVAALSLRELARDVGVSHAAPARHFSDRRSLLDAIAVRGFELLTTRIAGAVAAGDDTAARARGIALAYLGFITTEANLAEVMFRHEGEQGAETIGRAAATAFAPIVDLFVSTEQAESGDPAGATRAATLFLATLQGIAALINCGVVLPDDVPGLVADAVPRFIAPQRNRAGSHVASNGPVTCRSGR